MLDTIGCYDRDCICNRKEPKPCEKCEDGYIYEPWICEICGQPPKGDVKVIKWDVAKGICSGSGFSVFFERDRTMCKCQG